MGAANRHNSSMWMGVISILLLVGVMTGPGQAAGRHPYNGPYDGDHLRRIAFPIGGIGAGMICLEGTGAISHLSVRNQIQFFNEPCSFAALCVKDAGGNVAKVLEGPVQDWKVFGAAGTGNGAAGKPYGLPRFEEASFLARFPFATVTLADKEIPLKVELTGWSPFIPSQADASSLPVGALEYRFANPTNRTVQAVFSYNTKNFMDAGSGDTILPIEGGFILWQAGSDTNPEREGGVAIFVDDEDVVVDHCWFKGGWWDSLTLAWRNVAQGNVVANPPQKGSCPGASLFVPFALKPGQEKTVRLMVAWYVPKTDLRYGQDVAGPAFVDRPSKGTASGQQTVSGFQGHGLVNTFDPSGDAAVGTLTSPEFELTKDYIHFLVGGGNHRGKTCVQLIVDDNVMRSTTGRNSEQLEWATWKIAAMKGQEARIRIVDEEGGGWGHILVDQIVMTDAAQPGSAGVVLQDFEAAGYGAWTATGPDASEYECTCESTYHVPWYAKWFESINVMAQYWRDNYEELRRQSALFRDTFYDTTLPDEVVEAVAANLTILKSPTVLRQVDDRLWCFEGCSDNRGCCHGSCTHVWNYAQAICHLFPDLERSLRKTEFHESQDAKGHQTFRSSLPIRPVAHTFHAASDGQLGGIMKVYRDWRVSGDNDWLKAIWPQVKTSLEYCIATWDPRGRGVLEEPHHNTYDIEYWGPDGHCSSFYLGALTAAIEMGSFVGDDDVTRYRKLRANGRQFLETQLYNGEYFYQKVQTEGLNATFHPLDTSANGPGYNDTIKALNQDGPKYQYGTGCLSDGVLGFWMARVCGLDADIVDPAKVRSNLKAIHRYNLKENLLDHANPQRPSFALGRDGGLLLCTWPQGGAPALPFVYSDEVWTGIEYQVASHLMLVGLVDEGLEIVRLCRDRYDGSVRNPFNEYECGHWYARALSSYGLIQGLTGVRYDAVDKTLYIDSKVGDNFRAYLSTATGFGTVGLKNGKPFLDVKLGTIEPARVVVSGKEMTL